MKEEAIIRIIMVRIIRQIRGGREERGKEGGGEEGAGEGVVVV
jgi:hypothetical protein